MTPLQLQEILLQGKSATVEFKRCGNQPESDTFETVCSFSNRNGGSIYLGVNDDGGVVGLAKGALASIKRNIVNVTNNESLFSPTVVVELEEVELEGRIVLRVWVPMSSSIHRYMKTVYDRIEDADVRVESTDALAGMYLRKQNIYTEQRVFPYLTDSDLLLDRMGDYRRRAYARRAAHPWKDMSDREILRSMKLYALDYATGAEGYTLAAALLLGRDDVIASVCPAYRTDAIVRRDDVERYDDRLTVSTNLVDAHAVLSEYLGRFLPDRFYLEKGRAVSARDVIVREVVANSLMHREYIRPRPARLIVERDRLVADNASRSSFQGVLGPDNPCPISKNPVIAKFFNQIGLAEELGSGVPTLYRYTRAYAGADPVFTEGDVFCAVIPLGPAVGESEGPSRPTGADKPLTVPEAVACLLREQDTVTAGSVAALLDVSLRTVQRELAELVRQGKLLAEGQARSRKYRMPDGRQV